MPGRVHPPLPATPAPPPTRAAPSTAPTAPAFAPPPLPSDLAQMFEEPIGLGAAPAVPSAPSMAPTISSSSSPERLNSSPPRSSTAAVSVPAEKTAGFLWAVLADRWQGQRKAKRASSSSASTTSSAYACHPSCSSDDSEPEPGNTATHAPPPTRAAPFGAPAAPPAAPSTAPTAPLAAPPRLPADHAQMLDEPIGLGAAPAVPPAPSATPTVSSNNWLEQQQLAGVLEEQLTGVEAVEVSKPVRR